jgi:hypothetical protein
MINSASDLVALCFFEKPDAATDASAEDYFVAFRR